MSSKRTLKTKSKTSALLWVAGAALASLLVAATLYYSYSSSNSKKAPLATIAAQNLNIDNAQLSSSSAVTSPSLTFIVGDLGLNKKLLQMACELPKGVFLGLSPYAPQVTTLASDAISQGHRVLMHLPMQPKEYLSKNLGSYCLLNGLDHEQNAARLNWILATSEGLSGVYTNHDEVFTESDDDFKAFLKALTSSVSKDFIFVYNDSYSAKNAHRYLHELNAKHIQALSINVIVFPGASENIIKDTLEKAKAALVAGNNVVVLFYPDYRSIRIAAQWLQSMQQLNTRFFDVAQTNETSQ